MDVENSPLDTVLNVFQGQWLMWMNARDAQNARMMRMALSQAVSSQDLIIEMGGQREMNLICENWDAREELRRMDYLPHPSTNPPPQRLAITNYHHQSPAPPPNQIAINNYQYPQEVQVRPPTVINPPRQENAPAPMEGLRISPDQDLLGFNNQVAGILPPPSLNQPSGNAPPPPPPPPPPQQQRTPQHQQPLQQQSLPLPANLSTGHRQPAPLPTTTRQNHHHPYYQQPPPHYQPPPQYPVEAYYHGPPEGMPPPYWHGQRNFRRPRNPTSTVMEIGDYLLRAERSLGRLQRLRGRARGRGQMNQAHPPQPPPQ